MLIVILVWSVLACTAALVLAGVIRSAERGRSERSLFLFLEKDVRSDVTTGTTLPPDPAGRPGQSP